MSIHPFRRRLWGWPLACSALLLLGGCAQIPYQQPKSTSGAADVEPELDAAESAATVIPEPQETAEPGQLYEWNGHGRSISHVVIDTNAQRARFYEGQEQVGWTTIASGVASHPTPRGEFEVIEKVKDKRSNLYGRIYDASGNLHKRSAHSRKDTIPAGGRFVGARMPHFMRMTYDGIGIHAGDIPDPGEPASHGCIRLPDEVAANLFAHVDLGTRVTVVGDGPDYGNYAERIQRQREQERREQVVARERERQTTSRSASSRASGQTTAPTTRSAQARTETGATGSGSQGSGSGRSHSTSAGLAGSGSTSSNAARSNAGSSNAGSAISPGSSATGSRTAGSGSASDGATGDSILASARENDAASGSRPNASDRRQESPTPSDRRQAPERSADSRTRSTSAAQQRAAATEPATRQRDQDAASRSRSQRAGSAQSSEEPSAGENGAPASGATTSAATPPSPSAAAGSAAGTTPSSNSGGGSRAGGTASRDSNQAETAADGPPAAPQATRPRSETSSEGEAAPAQSSSDGGADDGAAQRG